MPTSTETSTTKSRLTTASATSNPVVSGSGRWRTRWAISPATKRAPPMIDSAVSRLTACSSLP
jgi:hypothetical protein